MRIITALLTVLILGCTDNNEATHAQESSPSHGARPNIVILFADDLGYGDLGSYGHPYIRTPHIDEMAREGQRWTDFYSASPVCSPSRAALLTGRYPVRTGQYGRRINVYFPGDAGGFPAGETTLAELLKDEGYRTGIFGKWHLGDRPEAMPTRHGFEQWLGIPYSNDMDWELGPDIEGIIALRQAGRLNEIVDISAARRSLYAEPVDGSWHVPLIKSIATATGSDEEIVERPADQSTLTKRYTEAAIEFMQAAGSNPFLVYLPYTMPHTPLFRSKPFVGHSLGGRYGDVIEEIDWSVGEIRLALKDLGQLENTLIVFTSDNGPWLTMMVEGGRAGLLKMGKGSTFEGGVRVPGIFSWPGRIKPGVVSDIGSTLDLYRTVAAIAGADGAAGVDGYDLSPTLFTGASGPRNHLAYYRDGDLYAWRQGPWKLHLRTEGAYGQPPTLIVHEQPLLNHLLKDPSERFDVAPAHPEVVTAINAEIQMHISSMTISEPAMDARLANLE